MRVPTPQRLSRTPGREMRGSSGRTAVPMPRAAFMRITTAALASSLVRFLLTGAANTLLGLGIIYALKLLGLHDVPANLLGYAFGIWISYAMHAKWTFSYAGSVRSA